MRMRRDSAGLAEKREIHNVARRYGCVRGSTRRPWIVSFEERGNPGSTVVLSLSGTARTITDTRAMHSLKELRAENAAKRLSSGRTAEDEDGASSPAVAPTATPATAAAPRAGRTLAPIGSTGSLPPSDAAAPAEPTAGDDAQQREDREARRRRRLRRRRERERENAGGDDNSKVSVDDNTTAVSGTSHTSTSRVDEDEEGGGAPSARDKGALLHVEGRSGRGSERERSEQVGAGPPTSRHQPAAAAPFVAEEKAVGDDAKNVDDEKNGSDSEKPLSARGAPPKEKPKKKLTPLEARRARIEQQKREEVTSNF